MHARHRDPIHLHTHPALSRGRHSGRNHKALDGRNISGSLFAANTAVFHHVLCNLDLTNPQLETYLETFKRLYGDAVSSGAMTTDKSGDDGEALAELQFSFVCFLVGQHYDSFEQWKQLLKMFCQSDRALSDRPDLYMALVQDLHFQVGAFSRHKLCSFMCMLNICQI